MNKIDNSYGILTYNMGRVVLGCLALAGLLFIAAPFFLRDAVPFFSVSEAEYKRFWPYAPSIFLHVVAGTLAMFLGPLQFIGSIRRRYPTVHRVTGYIYLGAITIGSLSAFQMSFHIELTRTVGFAVGLFCLAVCWLVSGVLAYYAIMKRNILLHQQLLAQNYALTFSFALTRWLWDLDIAFIQNMGPMRYITMGWAGWITPFTLVGFYFQFRNLNKKRKT